MNGTIFALLCIIGILIILLLTVAHNSAVVKQMYEEQKERGDRYQKAYSDLISRVGDGSVIEQGYWAAEDEFIDRREPGTGC